MDSVSGHCMHYTFKMCEIFAGMNVIRQFHEFVESHFWRVFDVWPNCVAAFETGEEIAGQFCSNAT